MVSLRSWLVILSMLLAPAKGFAPSGGVGHTHTRSVNTHFLSAAKDPDLLDVNTKAESLVQSNQDFLVRRIEPPAKIYVRRNFWKIVETCMDYAPPLPNEAVSAYRLKLAKLLRRLFLAKPNQEESSLWKSSFEIELNDELLQFFASVPGVVGAGPPQFGGFGGDANNAKHQRYRGQINVVHGGRVCVVRLPIVPGVLEPDPYRQMANTFRMQPPFLLRVLTIIALQKARLTERLPAAQAYQAQKVLKKSLAKSLEATPAVEWHAVSFLTEENGQKTWELVMTCSSELTTTTAEESEED